MHFDVNSPEDRSVLMAARAWGVSPSCFLGEPVRTITTYERDHSGNQIRSVTVAEPVWSDDDRTAALDLLEYEATLCPGCGDSLTETTRPEHEFAYRAEAPIRCHRCTASHVASQKYAENPVPTALFIPMSLRGNGETDHTE